jgi:DNA mismatch repair protein MutS
MRFTSILFVQPKDGADVDRRQKPSFFADLNLDQVLESITASREEYDLEPLFYTPLRSTAAVRYRHAVFADLERPELVESVGVFAKAMRAMREHLLQAEKLYEARQKQRWFLDAVGLYCAAVRALAAELAELEPRSDGLRAFREYLTTYIGSEAFASLAAETEALHDALASVAYSVHIHGQRVNVSRYEGEADYSAEVLQTFAKFGRGPVRDYRRRLSDWPDMNHVEARILDLVARLHPDVFQTLDEYRTRHAAYLDPAIAAFDREVQFYVAYLEYTRAFREAGLHLAYPEVSDSKEIAASEAFDLALANKLVPEGSPVVCNDFHLSAPERIIVVTGPNQGGKTTFARMFGQLHYLASLGVPVPAREAALFLADRLFAHFEKEEDVTTLRGKLDDELVRVHEILGEATSDSVIVMNESFTSTTLNDALVLGEAVLHQIIDRGSLCVYVTFVDELASLDEATVSMVGTVVPDDPATRTYKIVRKPADGLAYAAAIAEKYGLTYQSLSRRIAQ